jgi:hypothetical protein
MSGANVQFVVTFFENYAASTKRECRCTVYDLADLARDTTAATKAALPWWKLASFGDRRSGKDSLRHDANVKYITGVEADYDAGAMPFDDAAEMLDKLGVLSLLYTSPSHTEDTPRWRILCPLPIGMMPRRRHAMLGRLNGAFRGVFSRESWTLSQSYYYGSVCANPSHRVEVFLGHTIDQLDELDEAWIGPPGHSGRTSGPDAVSAEMREDAELIRCVVTGEHLHVELCALAARYIGRGIPAATVEGILRGVMLSRPEAARDARWQARYAEIPRLIESANDKYRPAARKEFGALARRLYRRGMSAEAVLATLRERNRERDDPLPDTDIIRTAQWAAT